MWDDGTHIKDTPVTHSCHIGVLAWAHIDILELYHVKESIVHNFKILVKSIQEDGLIDVLRRRSLKHTPQVTKLKP